MSEYWVSKKRYYCKYCEIYIADDVPSKQQHEGGLRHKGNKERFVRGLYKASEKKKHDLEEEKREMVRVERAAQAAFAQDVGAGYAKAGPSSAPAPPKPVESSAKPPKPSSPWANYSTAEQLGLTDPDAERIAAEAERKRTQGVVGNWEMVATPTPQLVEPAAAETNNQDPAAQIGQKREAEAPVDEDDTRQFKLRKKEWSAGLGEIWDPDVVPIKLKSKAPVTTASDTVQTPEASGLSSGTSEASERPKWTAKGWNKPGEPAAPVATEHTESAVKTEPITREEDGHGLVKKEEDSSGDPSTSTPTTPPLHVKLEEPQVKAEESSSVTEPAPTGGGMFRKRKAPVGTRGRRQV